VDEERKEIREDTRNEGQREIKRMKMVKQGIENR
jgi:hypothetical protein